jgi:CrcB protein
VSKLTTLLLVCLGGAVGSGARYGVALFTAARGWTVFPWATFFVNFVGCFCIAFVMTLAGATAMRENVRLFLTTGMIGGFTTYSTFDYETMNLIKVGEPMTAAAYLALTLVGCFVAGVLGLLVARLVA